MNNVALALLALFSLSLNASAGDHTQDALEHAEQAAKSKGDSAAVQEHATEALKHIDAAKAAGQPDHAKVMHLLHGEEDLKEAVEHAKHFNTPSASEDANAAAGHLQKAK